MPDEEATADAIVDLSDDMDFNDDTAELGDEDLPLDDDIDEEVSNDHEIG